MESKATFELIFVLVLMALIVVFGMVAVFIFVRTWRKERGKSERK